MWTNLYKSNINYYIFKISNNLNNVGKWGTCSSAGITVTFYNNAKGTANIIWLSKNQNTGPFMIVIDGIFGNVNFSANTAYKFMNLKCYKKDFAIYTASFMLAQTNAWTSTVFNIYHPNNVVQSQDFYVNPSTACWNVAGCLVMNGYIW